MDTDKSSINEKCNAIYEHSMPMQKGKSINTILVDLYNRTHPNNPITGEIRQINVMRGECTACPYRLLYDRGHYCFNVKPDGIKLDNVNPDSKKPDT